MRLALNRLWKKVLKTSNEMLSQEEIDALLHRPDQVDLDPDQYLSPFDRDALGEIGNISFGTAATTLSTLLRQKVNITTPQVTLLRREEFGADFPIPHVAARVEYVEGLSGSNILAIRMDDAQIIADLMLGGDGSSPAVELNELHVSAVAEAMNQMMGSAATSMAAMVARPVNISPPTVRVVDSGDVSEDMITPPGDVLVKVSFHLQVGTLIDSHIMQMLSLDFATSLVAMLMSAGMQGDESPLSAPGSSEPMQHERGNQGVTSPAVPDREKAMNAYAQSAQPVVSGYPEMSAQTERSARVSSESAPVHVEKAAFAAFGDSTQPRGGRNLDLLLDIPLGLTVELGRTKRLIRDILDLSSGSIIELDTLAGEPVDILVNNKLIARGEVVVIEENFGVRVTDIVSPAERIKRLQ